VDDMLVAAKQLDQVLLAGMLVAGKVGNHGTLSVASSG